MAHKRIIENNRVFLADVLRDVAPQFDELSIATGYWDLPGTQEILEAVKSYKKIRLLIGQEPLSPRNAKQLKIELPDPGFPEEDFAHDLEQLKDDSLRQVVLTLKEMVSEGRLEIRLYRRTFLHAKSYIFGSYLSDGAIGIIGSSNFTRAGLTANTELNALEENHMLVKFKPQVDTDEQGHLSWFDTLWDDDLNIDWDGKFTEILGNSPVGDLTFGAYDSYIKTLMEVYPDELLPPETLAGDAKDVLYSFQYRNAQILINKLERMGLAMLSDSVGLGKTITSGAVINHYKEKGATRIYVIAPASLKTQWYQDLAERFGLVQGFEVISLQDPAAVERARELDKYKAVDLFVIDEAHNLRNANSKRHQQIMDWLIANPQSKVLMLTATPINNSLMDFVNQIQLASKGSLDSINVDYRDENGNLHKTDFYNALAQIQSRIKRAEKQNKQFDWSAISGVVASGLRHYLVRTTRQGVKKMGGIILPDGTKKEFPESVVEQIGYHYSDIAKQNVDRSITSSLGAFEGHDPRKLDLDVLLDQTQRSEHPLDSVAAGSIAASSENEGNVFANLFLIVLLLGFTPYRPEIYQHRIHSKSVEEIRALGLKGTESFKVQSQLSIHNLLRVSWLKRLESSQAALQQSISNYQSRLTKFKEFLDQGKILTSGQINSLISEYGEDLEAEQVDLNEFVDADPKIYNLEALRIDLQRDLLITSALSQILSALDGEDDKLKAFAEFLKASKESNNKAKNKIVVFSYFSDTIDYLKKALPSLIDDPNFETESAFVTGSSNQIDKITRRFAPVAKKYHLQQGEIELNYLFATDVLSEGQNLQDAGCLVNYDLHWNPVRMIQRNGRINRLGSEFAEVYVQNMKPEDNLEAYLRLLNRLNRKINTIKNTIGLDQDVLEPGQMSPKEFIENHDDGELLNLLEAEETVAAQDQLNNDSITKDLYGDGAAEALIELENKENQFFAEDDYVYDLKNFLSRNSEHPEEVDRIRRIPNGKWGYLPASSTTPGSGNVLGLARVNGSTSASQGTFSDTHFVSINVSEPAFRTISIEDSAALKLLKTVPEDNQRRPDNIRVDRQLVSKRLIAAARAQAGKAKISFNPKPSEAEALGKFEELLPGRSLLKLVTTRISNKQEVRSIEKLCRVARSEIKQHGQILVSTIADMDQFSKKLSEKHTEETHIEEVSEVLFFAETTTN
ncbi:ERCC4-related helicase [Aurantimicrobium minutum]|uniref:SNF2-related protein n=1 Tax=Aurantimicrobium minutum TaxID=708131 RepID=UPI0024763E16|nr:SNF2-related protein [Aurantimicrobium minutum]MDH6410401.1 ERCC4-related helicase [Aurantimicrobium minutum]